MKSLIVLCAIAQAALPNAPNGYAPVADDCPASRPSIRNASSLSPNETAWLSKRRPATIDPLIDLLQRCAIPDFDAAAFINTHRANVSTLPNIALAFSGGGLRAMLTGAGVFQAFDSRESQSKAQLGGLLQAATYMSGLSGGGWLLGSVVINNYTQISALQNSNVSSTWQLQGQTFTSAPEGPKTQNLSQSQYLLGVLKDFQAKKAAGFQTSATDFWGRALSAQFINATNTAAYTWSSIQLDETFSNASLPLPFVLADERAPGQRIIPDNATIFEFNPFEFGSWDPTTYAFAPLEYLGTNFSRGMVAEGAKCVRGFDNAGFVMGTTSSIFNVDPALLPPDARGYLETLIKEAGGGPNADIANYAPNPFYQLGNETTQELDLVDGGEDGQNIPLYPLLQPVRNVDVVFAVDASADTPTSWPNGSALVKTYQRFRASSMANGTDFAAVPDINTFVNLGLNQRPTFFGCNVTNTPLIVYLPNAPYTTLSNASTLNETYSMEQRDAFIRNGYALATQSGDKVWPVCLACATLSRSFQRTNTSIPAACSQCFSMLCWNGTTNATMPAPYNPSVRNTTVSSGPPAKQKNQAGRPVASLLVLVLLCLITVNV